MKTISFEGKIGVFAGRKSFEHSINQFCIYNNYKLCMYKISGLLETFYKIKIEVPDNEAIKALKILKNWLNPE